MSGLLCQNLKILDWSPWIGCRWELISLYMPLLLWCTMEDYACFNYLFESQWYFSEWCWFFGGKDFCDIRWWSHRGCSPLSAHCYLWLLSTWEHTLSEPWIPLIFLFVHLIGHLCDCYKMVEWYNMVVSRDWTWAKVYIVEKLKGIQDLIKEYSLCCL